MPPLSMTAEERAAHERGLAAFLEPQQARLVERLLANSDGRAKIIEMLASDLRFAKYVAILIEPDEQSAAAIYALLTRIAPRANCYAMSRDSSLDGRAVSLADALANALGAGRGTFLSCVPGRLGYYQAEAPGERYILVRAA